VNDGWRWIHRQPRYLEDRWRTEGDRFRVDLGALGHGVVLAHPEDILAVFRTPAVRRWKAVFPAIDSGPLPRAEGHAHAGKRRQLLGRLRPDGLADGFDALRQLAEERAPTAEFSATALADELALAASSLLVFGRLAPALSPALLALLKSGAPAMVQLPDPSGSLKREHRARLAAARLAVDAEISAGLGPVNALLPGVEGDALTLVLVGVEPLAASLVWALVELAGHEDRVASDSSYRRAFIAEVLRLHPPFPTIAREFAEPVALNGVELQPGEVAFPSPWLCHRHPSAWSEPHRFDPTRMLDGTGPAWLPFGHGAHGCLGAATAMRQLDAVLAGLLASRRYSGASRPRLARRVLTFAPAGRVRMSCRRL
jgi:cytochrome P450